jgi:hypothetical protein
MPKETSFRASLIFFLKIIYNDFSWHWFKVLKMKNVVYGEWSPGAKRVGVGSDQQ